MPPIKPDTPVGWVSDIKNTSKQNQINACERNPPDTIYYAVITNRTSIIG